MLVSNAAWTEVHWIAEVSREQGTLYASKKSPMMLYRQKRKVERKIFDRPGSKRRPMRLTENYLSHLSPEFNSSLRNLRSQIILSTQQRMYCSRPCGHNTLQDMLPYVFKSWCNATVDKPPWLNLGRYVQDWTLMRFKFLMISITKCPHW